MENNKNMKISKNHKSAIWISPWSLCQEEHKAIKKVQMMEIGQGYNQPPHQTRIQQEKTLGPRNRQIQ
jgi:hypothetical protein